MNARGIRLRLVAEGDREALYRIAQDPESNEMAKVFPRSRASFDAHWDRVRVDPDVIARVIECDGELVGSISSFVVEGEHNIGYWVDRGHWGKGIMSAALGLFLREVTIRPMTAIVAQSNVGSRRVLEKCGFVKVGERESAETERFMACVEVVYRLD